MNQQPVIIEGTPHYEPHRIYRSRTERQVAGVAGGLAEFLGVDPTLIRIVWLISVLFGGAGALAYICLLYTSDAADDLTCVDLGGRRILQ